MKKLYFLFLNAIFCLLLPFISLSQIKDQNKTLSSTYNTKNFRKMDLSKMTGLPNLKFEEDYDVPSDSLILKPVFVRKIFLPNQIKFWAMFNYENCRDDDPFFDSDSLYLGIIFGNIPDTNDPQNYGDVLKTFHVKFFCDDSLVAFENIPGCQNNASYCLYNIILGKLSPGIHRLKVILDCDNEIIERNKSDNVYQRTFIVYKRLALSANVTGANNVSLNCHSSKIDTFLHINVPVIRRDDGWIIRLGRDTSFTIIGKDTSIMTSNNCSFTVLNGRDYTLTPSKPPYHFSPPNAVFTNLQENKIVNFMASLKYW